jgi:hypothetical protein
LSFRRLTKHNLFQSGLRKADAAESITSEARQGYKCPNFTQPLHIIERETLSIDIICWFCGCYNNVIPLKKCCKKYGILLFSLQLHHLVPGQTGFCPESAQAQNKEKTIKQTTSEEPDEV